ncbi:MAG: PhoH family protein, partial [Candidatus Hodarchaeales archaeon]
MVKKKPERKTKNVPFNKVRIPKIQPKSKNQTTYLNSIRDYEITFSIGPAGTGKTFLACYSAAKRLVRSEVSKIILTRPAIEAG